MTTFDASSLHHADLLDRDGDKVGSVAHVYLDAQTSRAAWVEVTTGWFGLRRSLVPLDGAQRQGDAVQVPYDADTIKAAPNFDVTDELDAADEDALYAHYGLDAVADRSVSGGNRYVEPDRTTLSGTAPAPLPEGAVEPVVPDPEASDDLPSGDPLRSGELLGSDEDGPRRRRLTRVDLDEHTGATEQRRDVRNDL